MSNAEQMPDRIWADRDEETNEKHWFSCKGMGVEYVRADLTPTAALAAEDLQRAAQDVLAETDTLEWLPSGVEDALRRLERAALSASPSPVDSRDVEGSPLLEWAVSKWNSEVKNRPLRNVHRRSLDDAWRQVIRWAGGDPDKLVGLSHDELLAMGSKR